MKDISARGVFYPMTAGLAALMLMLGASARAGEAPPEDAPAPEEEAPVVVEPAPEPEVADDEAATDDAPPPVADDEAASDTVSDDAPSPIDDEEAIPDIWGPEPERPPTWVKQSIARDAKMRVKYVRAYQAEAIKALHARRYKEAIRACERAMAIDPENLAIERLLSLARQELQAYRLLVEAERSLAADEETLAEVSYESRFPGKRPVSERPKLPLREDMPESEGLRRMNELLNQRVSMNFVEADLEYVLQTLFKTSNVNIIADQSVVADKTLSLHVENVPLREILDFIKRNYDGVEYTVTEHSVLLTTPESPPLFPRTYPLSRGIIGQESFQTGTRRTSSNAGAVSRSISTAAGGRSGGSSGRSGGGGLGGGGESYLESVLTWVESWENEWPQGSQWYLDRQTNTLFVLTTSEMHKRVGEILDVIDTVPVQILVRTKFIEVDANDSAEAGLGFMFADNDALDYKVEVPGSDPVRYTYPVEDRLDSMQLPGVIQGGSISLNRVFTLDAGKLLARLTLLEEKKRTKVLSAPQIIAMNNRHATIDVGKSFSYPTNYQSASTTVATDDPAAAAFGAVAAFVPSSYEELTAGFSMEFVPSVGRDMKTITLDLHARIDEVKNIDEFDSTSVITSSALQSEPPAIPRPIIDAREFTTQIVIEDGHAVVIGGLLKNNTEIINRKIPILGDIPLLGIPFRYKKEVTRQSNLIIIVQAQIVKPDGSHYVDADAPEGGVPSFGMQSFGSAPKKTEWIRDLPPELERDILLGAGR